MWICPKCGREFENSNQNHFCQKPSTIDEYIQSQSSEIQPTLQKIRETIKQNAPNAKEKISYSMPTFWQMENLIHFTANKNHIGIYPGAEAIVEFEKKLSGYKTSKGAIQMLLSKPIDFELIAEITRWRVTKVESGK